MEQKPQDIRVERFKEVIVRTRVDHFERGSLFVIGAEDEDERVDLAALQTAEKFDAFPDAAGRHGNSQEQNVEFALLEKLIGFFVVTALQNFEVGAEYGGEL